MLSWYDLKTPCDSAFYSRYSVVKMYYAVHSKEFQALGTLCCQPSRLPLTGFYGFAGAVKEHYPHKVKFR
jgi:hypothetical protein